MVERRTGSVLVIEDDDILVHLFEAILQQAGFEMRAATSADAAKSMLAQRKFDVVVCDLSVAGGKKVFDLVTNLRSQHPEIAILIVTGYTPDEIASKVAFHDVELLEKPFSPPDLVKRILTLLKRRAA